MRQYIRNDHSLCEILANLKFCVSVTLTYDWKRFFIDWLQGAHDKMSTLVTEEDKRQFLKDYVEITEEQWEQARTCEQGTAEWKNWRLHRIGQSACGTVAGHNHHPNATEDKVLINMLWGYEEPNEAMRKGTIMEDTGIAHMQIALKSHFEQLGYKDIWVEQTGTCIWKEHPWLTASSDGLIYCTGGPPERPTLFGTAENKVPDKDMFYDRAPHQYVDQFQGTAIILGAEFIVFNIYTPVATQVNFYDVDKNYWMTEVFPKLQTFYMNRYIPLAILKQRGILQPGQITLQPAICLNITRFKGARKKSEAKKIALAEEVEDEN